MRTLKRAILAALTGSMFYTSCTFPGGGSFTRDDDYGPWDPHGCYDCGGGWYGGGWVEVWPQEW